MIGSGTTLSRRLERYREAARSVDAAATQSLAVEPADGLAERLATAMDGEIDRKSVV